MSRVSCIIPTYNREKRLPGAIKSVQNQTYDDLEILVVDGSSTDGTADVIADYADTDDRIVPLTADKGTPMGARNIGIEAATGEYIAFLDDDDRWAPKKTETQVRYADEYSAVSCIPRIVQPERSVVQSHDFSGVLEQDVDDVFRGIRHFFPSGTLIEAKHIYEINGFDEEYIEWDFYIRLVKECGPAAVIDKPLVDFNREDIDRISEDKEIYRNLFDIYERYKHLASRSARRKRLSNIYSECFEKDDRLRVRLSSLGKMVYYDPSKLQPLGKRLAVWGLDRTNLKGPVKRVLNRS